jgi:hypothetical protein
LLPLQIVEQIAGGGRRDRLIVGLVGEQFNDLRVQTLILRVGKDAFLLLLSREENRVITA